jgi:hypothetical protein
MSFLKMLLSFAPWLSFLIIAHGSMFRLKLGIVVAAVITVINRQLQIRSPDGLRTGLPGRTGQYVLF